jgi:predicted nucleic acid-binding Zn ribbon protein
MSILRRRTGPKPKLGPPRKSASQRVLANWHGGVDYVGIEKAMGREAKSAAELTKAAIGRLGLEKRRAETEIVNVWNHALDPQLVAHAHPSGIHKGTLFVDVDSSVWLDEIVRYRRHEILQRLQHSFGEDLIKRISFRIG